MSIEAQREIIREKVMKFLEQSYGIIPCEQRCEEDYCNEFKLKGKKYCKNHIESWYVNHRGRRILLRE